MKKIILSNILRILCNTLVLVIATNLFSNYFYIDLNYCGIWCLLAATIIYLLNKTIKPIITWLTLPLTAITLGLFYPFINVIIIKLVSLILGTHFVTKGIFILAFISIFISILNIIMNHYLVKPLIRRGR